MKSMQIAGAAALLVSMAMAAPAPQDVDYSKVQYSPGTGANLHEYPDGTGENLHEYATPPGGYENVQYPPGTGSGGNGNQACVNGPFKFTSTYHVIATPDQVVNGTKPTGGLPGTMGTYDLGINSDEDYICYKIVITGFQGEYSSPARTATHLHSAARGASGPPRISFPNPEGTGHERVSIGCMVGPFTTGLKGDNGQDTGIGFTLKQVEDNPAGYMADVHSSLAVPGAVRGQLA